MKLTNSNEKKVLIIDDHRLFTDGLRLILRQLDPTLLVSAEHNSNRALANIESLADFDLLLVDLQMPGLDGFALLEALSNRKPSLAVMVISGTEDYESIERAFALGAMGFVPKSSPGHLILHGINAVLSGNRYVPEELMEKLEWQKASIKGSIPRKSADNTEVPPALIRPRQLEVLKLIRDGHPNARIASILGISESAVKSHVSILFNALGVRNRTSCVQAAAKKGII
ncbi:MAG: response regulator transcription factor [Acidiferrobacterales bacterium]|nr:response regulator transcription factor [Acidiferrobacterales bacterium]